MKLWITIITTFVIQELVTVNASLLHAYKAGYNLLLVSAIFIAASVLDVIVGHHVGVWVQRKYSHRTFVQNLTQKAQALEHALGHKGHKVAFTVLGFVNFNYVNAFLASWTNVPFLTTLKFLVLGDVLWYCLALLMVTGVSTFIDPLYAMHVVVGISVSFMIGSMLVHRKVMRNRGSGVIAFDLSSSKKY